MGVAMRYGSWLVLIVLLAVAGLAWLNWPVIVAPTTLSLGLTTVQAPLGLLLLGLLVLELALCLLYALVLHTLLLRDKRNHAKELQALRAQSEQAEASRLNAVRDTLMGRIDQLERELRLAIDQSGNSLAASLGEMDDRLRRQLPPQP